MPYPKLSPIQANAVEIYNLAARLYILCEMYSVSAVNSAAKHLEGDEPTVAAQRLAEVMRQIAETGLRSK
jgi:hypothetical protein